MTLPCDKCGGTDVRMIYHARGCDQQGCSCARCTYGSYSKEHEEHLHYHCQNCHFDWVGPCADTPETKR